MEGIKPIDMNKNKLEYRNLSKLITFLAFLDFHEFTMAKFLLSRKELSIQPLIKEFKVVVLKKFEFETEISH